MLQGPIQDKACRLAQCWNYHFENIEEIQTFYEGTWKKCWKVLTKKDHTYLTISEARKCATRFFCWYPGPVLPGPEDNSKRANSWSIAVASSIFQSNFWRISISIRIRSRWMNSEKEPKVYFYLSKSKVGLTNQKLAEISTDVVLKQLGCNH